MIWRPSRWQVLTSVIGRPVLVVLGVGGYLASDRVSPTALIPAAFGVVLVLLGLYGRAPAQRRTAMHLAMGLALVGILGTAGGLITLVEGAAAGSAGVSRLGMAPVAKGLMALTLIVYLAIGVRSFIRARG